MGMFKGTALAFILITGILIFALKDIKVGLISIIPNVVPALYGLRHMGACLRTGRYGALGRCGDEPGYGSGRYRTFPE